MITETGGLFKMTTTRYTATAIVLHWLMALLIFVVFPLGLYMTGLTLSPTKLQLYSYHKWLGVTLLVLALLRILWRVAHRPPQLDLPVWQKRLSDAVHMLLYALLIAIPMSGWLMSSAKGFQTVWLGIVPLPDLIEKDKELGHLLAEIHANWSYLLLVVVALHIAAALKHRYIDRDEIMGRMFFGRDKS